MIDTYTSGQLRHRITKSHTDWSQQLYIDWEREL